MTADRAQAGQARTHMGHGPSPASVRGPAGSVLRLQAMGGNRAVRSLLRQAATLEGLDLAYRQKLQEATAPLADDFVDEGGFGVDVTRLPEGTEVVFGATVPKDAKFREGLKSTAADMLNKRYESGSASAANTNFRENSTVKFAYDFSKLKGADGIWQFTYLALAKAGTHRLLIEYLGKAPSYAVPTGGSEILSKHGFTMKGFGGSETDHVQEAFGLLPDKAIAKLPTGLKFARAKEPSVVKGGCTPGPKWAAGDYCDTNKTITMYDQWLAPSAVRFARSDEMTRAIVHELGHAIDLTHATDHAAFTDALSQDGGTPVTGYAAASSLESYAECFSLFITDPDLLKALRPSVHALFAGQFT